MTGEFVVLFVNLLHNAGGAGRGGGGEPQTALNENGYNA